MTQGLEVEGPVRPELDRLDQFRPNRRRGPGSCGGRVAAGSIHGQPQELGWHEAQRVRARSAILAAVTSARDWGRAGTRAHGHRARVADVIAVIAQTETGGSECVLTEGER